MQDGLPTNSIPPHAAGHPVTRIGTAVFGGTIAALVASLPATTRIAAGNPLARFVALAALATPIAVLAVGVFRRLRAGAQIVAGDALDLWGIGAFGWATLQLLFAGAFATMLRKNTHHHGLAGVTFAIVVVVAGILLGVLAFRATKKMAALSEDARRVALVVAAGSTLIVLVVAGARTAHAEELHTAGGLIDAFALGIAAAGASSKLVANNRALAIAGAPLAVAVVIAGLVALRLSAGLSAAAADAAPIHALLLGLVG